MKWWIGNVKYVFVEFFFSIMFLFCVRCEINRKCCLIWMVKDNLGGMNIYILGMKCNIWCFGNV